MKRLSVYKIEPESLPSMYVAARSDRQAAEIYVTWEAAEGHHATIFTVELVRLASFDPEWQAKLQTLLATRSEGILRFDYDTGWSIETDSWLSFDPKGEWQ
jgi:hypothetical protein